ncbi:DUF885 family protein [Streptomyces sp. NPDC004050]
MLASASLIYHELAPGHHLHLARQAENRVMPQLRREVAAFGAFNEGWAEYAAGLDRARTVLPRQALSYRAGYLEFLWLRAASEAELGAGFDVRAFHEAVLGAARCRFRLSGGA